MPKNDSVNGTELYHAASDWCLYRFGRSQRSLLPLARREKLAENTCRQAIEWLRKAQSLKYLSTPSTRFLLADDRDLEPLRPRDDFRALLANATRCPDQVSNGLVGLPRDRSLSRNGWCMTIAYLVLGMPDCRVWEGRENSDGEGLRLCSRRSNSSWPASARGSSRRRRYVVVIPGSRELESRSGRWSTTGGSV